MCVAAWGETGELRSYKQADNVSILHITELLDYDLKCKKVEIYLIFAVSVPVPLKNVFLHLVHRRLVYVENVTNQLINPTTFLGNLSRSLSLIQTSDPCFFNTNWQKACLSLLNGEVVDAVIPKDDILFARDDFDKTSAVKEEDIPFTSSYWGPIAGCQFPYLMGLSIRIEGPTFDKLILSSKNHLLRYFYSIEGPSIVARDIQQIDLIGASSNVREVYSETFDLGISKLSVPIASYDVITCDVPNVLTSYIRLLVSAQRCLSNMPIKIGTTERVVNGWNSRRMDFLIQKITSFRD